MQAGCRRDAEVFRGNDIPGAMDHIICNVTGTYRITGIDGEYTEDHLIEGGVYPGQVLRITKTGGALLDAGDISIVF